MSWEQNIYYSPEKCGAEVIATLEDDEPYEFDIALAVKIDGGVYLAHDSGCSCPTPFEDVRGVGDMTQVRDRRDIERFLKAQAYSRWGLAAELDFARKVEAAL